LRQEDKKGINGEKNKIYNLKRKVMLTGLDLMRSLLLKGSIQKD
jgi:hypothetical protein